MGAIDSRLAELGLDLPKAPPPAANYVPALRSGNLIFIAGQVCFGTDGKLSDRHKGKLGAEVSDEMGREAARLCGSAFTASELARRVAQAYAAAL